MCTGPITYQGQTAVQRDIDTFKAALAGVPVEEAFIPAVAPGTIELQPRNAFYPTGEAYLFTIAEAMREEYRAIVDAGFLLQIDDPRVVTQYDMPNPAPSTADYQAFAERRVEALNHALVGIPTGPGALPPMLGELAWAPCHRCTAAGHCRYRAAGARGRLLCGSRQSAS